MEISYQRALSLFLPLSQEHRPLFLPTFGGVNNVVKRVQMSSSTYIIRIYNNGQNLERVRYQHAVLKGLKGISLPFLIPQPIPSINHSFFQQLPQGDHVSLFKLIPGKLPQTALRRQIGEAVAILSKALAQIKIDEQDAKCPNPPYWDIYKVHKSVSKESFQERLGQKDFDDCRQQINQLIKKVHQIQKQVEQLHKLKLPTQLIHGDLHCDNVLVETGLISGVIDFEFVAEDWRAMDLAISLTKYAHEKQAMVYFDEMISGYFSYLKLNQDQIQAIPALLRLRILSNVVYFTGRILGQEDCAETLKSRTRTYLQRLEMIEKRGGQIRDLMKRKL